MIFPVFIFHFVIDELPYGGDCDDDRPQKSAQNPPDPGQYPPEVEADRTHLEVETIPVSTLEVIALHPVVVL